MLNIEITSPVQLKVTLTSGDLALNGLSYNDLDYASDTTKKFLWSLLRQANEKQGFKYCSFEKMLIEVFPSPGGGCVIYFTCMDEKVPGDRAKLRLKRSKGEPSIYEFKDSSDLLDAMKVIANKYSDTPSAPRSTLYLLNGSYRLIIYPALSSDVTFILSEYGKKTGSGSAAAAYLSEHGKVLADGDAFFKIGNLFK